MVSKNTYNNEAYKNLIIEFFGEIFYLPGLSYGTRIHKLRQYTEIIVRRLLNYPCNKMLELGHKITIEKLEKRGFVEPLFTNSLEVIRNSGNDRSHTEVLQTATEAEYRSVLDNVFNLYGYLFYRFFKKWHFGSNDEIVSKFSILPPIIRHITLSALYNDEPKNIIIIDKLVIAKLKAFDKETANQWIEENKDLLCSLTIKPDSAFIKKLIAAVGIQQAYAGIASMTSNMYDNCRKNIQLINDVLNSKPLYKDFETAKCYYEQNGIARGNSGDIIEFNDLMEFVYLGRRTKEKEIDLIPEYDYIITN